MLTYLLLTVGLFLIFLILLFTGIIKKRRKPVYFSLLFLLLAGLSGLYTGFLFAGKAYRKLKTVKIENPLAPRTGMEIYTALFGKPETNCVTVINKMDQIVPRLDCCIWLEFTTCPKELSRIISLHPFKEQPVTTDTTDLSPGYSPMPEWFTPRDLGAGLHILQKYNSDDPNHALILYFSKDSTHAFYCDMAE